MKKTVKIILLATVILLLFTSCQECAVCGKSKLITTKKSFLGREYYICKECEELPASTINGVINEFKDVTSDIKNGIVSVKDNVVSAAEEVKTDVKTAANEVKSGVKSITNEIKGIFNK